MGSFTTDHGRVLSQFTTSSARPSQPAAEPLATATSRAVRHRCTLGIHVRESRRRSNVTGAV